MSTTIHVTRSIPFKSSDAVRDDATLQEEAATLGDWLAEQDLEFVTMNKVLAFVQLEHPNATLARAETEYVLAWDTASHSWKIVCVSRGVVAYTLPGETSAIHVVIAISAQY